MSLGSAATVTSNTIYFAGSTVSILVKLEGTTNVPSAAVELILFTLTLRQISLKTKLC